VLNINSTHGATPNRWQVHAIVDSTHGIWATLFNGSWSTSAPLGKLVRIVEKDLIRAVGSL
jgi:hypothetical protein